MLTAMKAKKKMNQDFTYIQWGEPSVLFWGWKDYLTLGSIIPTAPASSVIFPALIITWNSNDLNSF